MNSLLSLTSYGLAEDKRAAARRKERSHRLRIMFASAVAISIVVALAVYGFSYYVLSASERPLSPKHHLLRPSGSIGIQCGVLGLLLFVAIFIYPLRKRIRWLGKIGSSKHWLDFHIVFGLTAPVIIAFHASFKFQGIAGMAFWMMSAVAASGIIGRYIYAQIPQSLNSAEVSLNELGELDDKLTRELSEQTVLHPSDFKSLLNIPTPQQVREMPIYRALLLVVALDFMRPFQVARLRARVLGAGALLLSLGGLLRSSNRELERVVASARRKSSLAKRIAFLSRMQQIFHLWHVIHRPFSYSFAVLALIHLAVVTMLGFV
jgi:hypothetical protein